MKKYHLQIYNLGEARMKQMCERRGKMCERWDFND